MVEPVAEEKPKRSRTRTRRKVEKAEDLPLGEAFEGERASDENAMVDVPEGKSEVAEKPKRKRAPRKPKVVAEVEVSEPAVEVVEPTPAPEPEPTPEPVAVVETVAEPEPVATAPVEEPVKPKRRGWWSLK